MKFDFKVLTVVGTCLGLGVGTIYLKNSQVDAYPTSQSNGLVHDCPYLKWDYNWDGNQQYKVSKEGKVRDSSKNSKWSRTIWLINDVQHRRSNSDLDQIPTTIGILQGRLCAATLQRLKSFGVKWGTAYYSTMLRTTFQADVIKKALNDKDMVWKSTELLVEGMPVKVSPKAADIPGGRRFSKFYNEGHPRIEAAFRTIFYSHRPNSEQKTDSNDLVLTHPNIIRYFICRALQMPPEAFSRFTLNHASITKIKIHGDGYVTVEGIGDAGFMPPTLLTSGEISGCAPVIVDPDVSRSMHRTGFKVDSDIPDTEFLRLLGDFEDHAKAAKIVS